MQTSGNFSEQAITKASFVSLLFFFWALIVVYKFKIYPQSPAISIFYALMLINTYFSVRAFATITPKGNPIQGLCDFLLGICLAGMPLVFNSPINFVLINLFLFIIATLKYIFLIQLSSFSKLLFRKIRIDVLGILLCALCLAGILFGLSYWSLKLFAFTFLLANIYVLFHRPLYLLEHHLETSIENFFKK
jgi:hypothetical protein